MSNVRSHVPHLLVFERTYYSQSDEAAFHSWLTSIPGVRRVRGEPRGLVVTLRSIRLSEASLRDLLALHYRYGLPMKDLAVFKNEANREWFCDPEAYWYEHVFGASAVSADLEARLNELRSAGVSPVEAIKAIRQEYGIPLGEAKRRLSLSLAWAALGRASAPLQEEAIRVVESGAGGPDNAT